MWQGLIFSWGDQKQAFQRFSGANQVLRDLKDVENHRHATDLEKCRDDTRRIKEKINKIEEYFSGPSQIACERINQIASQTSGNAVAKAIEQMSGNAVAKAIEQMAAVAKAIEQMCNVDALQRSEITETMEDTPYKLAVRIQEERDKTDAFQSFADCVEEDLNRTLEDEGKRQQLLTWFKSESASNLRADLENQQSASSQLVQKDDQSEPASEGRRWSQPFQMVSRMVGWTRTNHQNPSQEVEE